MEPITTSVLGLTTNITASLILEIIKDKVDAVATIKTQLKNAYGKALKNTGVENSRIREKYLFNAEKFLTCFIDGDIHELEINYKIFIRKVINQFKLEITKYKELCNFVLIEYSEKSLNLNRIQFECINDRLDVLCGITQRFEYFDEISVVLGNEHFHPNYWDFENGLYYKNEKTFEKIHKLLENNRKCLVVGKPGTGKTALGRYFGYEFEQLEPDSIVYYLDIKKFKGSINANILLNEIALFDVENSLFIIDNCHLDIETVNSFISLDNRIKNAKLLFLSRKVDEAYTGQVDESFFEILKQYKVQLKLSKNLQLNILETLTKQEQDRPIGDKELIYEKCKKDLFLLRYYIEAWQEQEDTIIALSDIEENAVLEKVFRRYLAIEANKKQLLQLAALSQFEIEAENNYFTESNENVFSANSLIESYQAKTMGRNVLYLEYFHSTPAMYLLKAAEKRDMLNRQTIDDFVLDTLGDYLKYKPSNFFNVFFQLYINEKKVLSEKLFELVISTGICREFVFEQKEYIFNEESIFIDFVRFTKGVYNFNEKQGKDLFDYFISITLDKDLQEKISKLSFLQAAYLLSLQKLNESFTHSLISELNFGKLGNEVKGKISATTVAAFLQHSKKAGVSREKLNKFCKDLDFGDLGKRTKGILSAVSVSKLLKNSKQAGVSRENLNKFCEGLNFGDLGSRARESNTSLNSIFDFLKFTKQAGVDDNKISLFCDELKWENLGRDYIGDNDCLTKNTLFLFHRLSTSSGFDKEHGRLLMDGLGWENIRNTLYNSMPPDSLAAFQEFLTQKCRYTYKALRERHIFFNKNTWFNSFILFPRSYESKNPPFHRLIEKAGNRLLYWNKKVEQLLKNKNIMTLKAWSIFIYNISEASPDFFERKVIPIIKSISKKEFEELFINSDLQYIGYFLSYFEEGGILHGNFELPDIDFSKLFDNNHEKYFNNLKEAKLEELDLLLWNMLYAFPDDQVPVFFDSSNFTEILKRHFDSEKKIQFKKILPIVGTLYISGSRIPNILDEYLGRVDIQNSINHTINKISKRTKSFIAGLIYYKLLTNRKIESITQFGITTNSSEYTRVIGRSELIEIIDQYITGDDKKVFIKQNLSLEDKINIIAYKIYNLTYDKVLKITDNFAKVMTIDEYASL